MLSIQLHLQLDGTAPILLVLWVLLLPLLLIFPRAAKLIHDQRAATYPGSIHDIRRLVAQRLVRTLEVVEGEMPEQADHQIRAGKFMLAT